MTKIQKESNSQRRRSSHSTRCGVVTYDKDTKRKQFTTPFFSPCLFSWCCDLWQRYKKKAIHNVVVLNLIRRKGVVTYDKDTKRKQFTTTSDRWRSSRWVLWPMTKIQKFMTGQESTLRGNPGLPFLCASRMGRDFFLYGDRFFCFLSILKFLYCPASRESLSLRA